jgi:hypothetical protein
MKANRVLYCDGKRNKRKKRKNACDMSEDTIVEINADETN